uniref:Uncharacterized protein n=1 Tax=Chromera velia CCMP2878 TaxID=1169474 RepID=A0A0G4HIY2_9ALVE|eukprot:Cvel_7025.t1-p1 / transcript=Cvel_7025.t1 / gene=Cvel_7025 / organism=Chromera_velia_CCMP2878 / gene_product=Polyribonucleotide 5'-hydroxyl-kinase Clp1, putative / transcript_product=Polyribonucleotide 5'-hydroxyl-kinase Clp1, putative / location=Cvel_scaffold358:34740-40659(-) / protein_length=606 / sequence_SO=supercontig / SO=protein_coding / is_pseudo=false
MQQARYEDIRPLHELRVATTPDKELTITLKEGNAEIFGRELPATAETKIPPGSHISVFSYYGCQVALQGTPQDEPYSIDAEFRVGYLNVAEWLQDRRKAAAEERTVGPRVLVTGFPDSGKTVLCQLLCNYAVRQGWAPIFVELDSRGTTENKSFAFLPGTEPTDPLVYFTGTTRWNEQTPVFQEIVKTLGAAVGHRVGGVVRGTVRSRGEAEGDKQQQTDGDAVMQEEREKASAEKIRKQDLIKEFEETEEEQRKRRAIGGNAAGGFAEGGGDGGAPVPGDKMEHDEIIAASGLIINAPFFADDSLIRLCKDSFGVDVILVVGDNALERRLKSAFADTQTPHLQKAGQRGQPAQAGAKNEATAGVQVVGVKRSEGAQPLTEERQHKLFQSSFNRYFVGDPSTGLRLRQHNIIVTVSEKYARLIESRAMAYGKNQEDVLQRRHHDVLGESEVALWTLELAHLEQQMRMHGEKTKKENLSVVPLSPSSDPNRMRDLHSQVLAVTHAENPAELPFANMSALLLCTKVEEVQPAAAAGTPTMGGGDAGRGDELMGVQELGVGGEDYEQGMEELGETETGPVWKLHLRSSCGPQLPGNLLLIGGRTLKWMP